MSCTIENITKWEDGKISIKIRDNKINPNEVELLMSGFLGFDKDIILYVNRETHEFTSETIETHIKINDNSKNYATYETFKLDLYGKCFLDFGCLKNVRLRFFVSDEWYLPHYFYNDIQIDEFHPVIISLSGQNYIDRKSDLKTDVTVKGPNNLAFCRVAVFDKENYDSNEIEKLMNFKPFNSEISYIDYYENTFSVELIAEMPTWNTIVAIPFDSNGICLGFMQEMHVYINRYDNYTWSNIGKGTVTEAIGHIGIPRDEVFSPATWDVLIGPSVYDVDIEQANENPGFFRLVDPFGKKHPLYDRFWPVDSDDDYFLYIDATDPFRVRIPFSFTGFLRPDDSEPIYVTSSTFATDEYGYSWGKFSDRRIWFNTQTIFPNWGGIYDTPDYKELDILFPGYEEYPISLSDDNWDNEMNITVNVSNKITTIDCALVHENDIRNGNEKTSLNNFYFPEIIFKKISSGDNSYGVKSYTVKDGEVKVNGNELGVLTKQGEGIYYLAVVPRDSDGNPHDGIFGPYYRVYNNDKWKTLGKAQIEENSTYMFYGVETINQGTCIVQEDSTQPGLYRLIDAYKEIADITESELYISRDLYIDASNPQRVNFVVDDMKTLPDTEFGVQCGHFISVNYGEYYVNSLGNYNAFLYPYNESDNDYGTKSNNVITFEGGSVIFSIPKLDYLGIFRKQIINYLSN